MKNFIMVVDKINYFIPDFPVLKRNILKNNSRFTLVSNYVKSPTIDTPVIVRCENKPMEMRDCGISWAEIDS